MNLFKKIMYNVIYMLLIIGAAALTVINILPHINQTYNEGISQVLLLLLCFFSGGLLFSFLTVLLHEVGHMVFGVLNGFKVVGFKIFTKEFVRTKTQKNKSDNPQKLNKAENSRKQEKKVNLKNKAESFSYGSCELISVKEGKYRKRYILITLGGLLMSLLVFLALFAVNLLLKSGNSYVYAAFSLSLLISLHVFLSAFIPAEPAGTMTDGALLLGLIKKSDAAIVMLALLSIQTQMYKGKRPSEIEKDLYFKLPVLQDGTVASLYLFAYRYLYCLDARDFEKAAEINRRIAEHTHIMQQSEVSKLFLNIVFDLIIEKNEHPRARATFQFIKNNIDDSITSDRIQAYYYKYVDIDEELSKKFADAVLSKEQEKELKGIFLMEKDLVKAL